MPAHTKLGIFSVHWCENHKKISILTILNLALTCARFFEMGIVHSFFLISTLLTKINLLLIEFSYDFFSGTVTVQNILRKPVTSTELQLPPTTLLPHLIIQTTPHIKIHMLNNTQLVLSLLMLIIGNLSFNLHLITMW